MKYFFEMICIRKERWGAVLLQGEAAQLKWDTDSFMFTAEQIKEHKGTGKGGKAKHNATWRQKGKWPQKTVNSLLNFPSCRC